MPSKPWSSSDQSTRLRANSADLRYAAPRAWLSRLVVWSLNSAFDPMMIKRADAGDWLITRPTVANGDAFLSDLLASPFLSVALSASAGLAPSSSGDCLPL